MRTLWVCLVPFPPLCDHLGQNRPSHCGWLYSSAKSLIEYGGIELGVIVYSYSGHYEHYHIDGVDYYMIPTRNISKVSRRQISLCTRAIDDFQPDLIHIHGTEHSLAQAACMANNGKAIIVANIQGLAGPYERYADGGMSFIDKLSNITPLDFFRGTFMLNARRTFRHRANCENYVLDHITDIIGRTRWDMDHVMSVNPGLNYHFMNESLRDSFYEEPVWSYDKCNPHSIFVSNSGTPLKGAHKVLEALPLILRTYPDTIVRFCGSSVLKNDFKSLLRMQGYHLYLRRLVKRLGVTKHVEFLGALSEHQMKQAYLDANVYVLPSAIENSPNSLCEAQILGIPVIAAYAGGVPSLVKDGVTGFLYRYEETEMLAQIVMRIFEMPDYTDLSASERQEALMRHDRLKNAERLSEIYNEIIR